MLGDQLGHLADEVDVLVDRAGHLLELGVVGDKVPDVADALDLLLAIGKKFLLSNWVSGQLYFPPTNRKFHKYANQT